jgi:hypothetical protein
VVNLLVPLSGDLPHCGASNRRFHGIGVDVLPGKRYSVPILGKYLVIIAKSAKHPKHPQFPVSSPFPPTKAMDLIGGHFSA